MVDSLTGQHEATAEELTGSILLILEKVVNRIEGDDGEIFRKTFILTTNHSTDKSIRKLVFLRQVTEELTSRSPFVERIGCRQIARDGEA